LHAAVEEQLEQPARQIVMMRDVLAGKADRVMLVPPAGQGEEAAHQTLPAYLLKIVGVAHPDIDEVI
jgi:hypothetical protein